MHYIDILKGLTEEQAYDMVFEIAKSYPDIIEKTYAPNFELDKQGRLKYQRYLKDYVQYKVHDEQLNKIQAIKLTREVSGMGLKDAKYFVEKNIDSMPPMA